MDTKPETGCVVNVPECEMPHCYDYADWVLSAETPFTDTAVCDEDLNEALKDYTGPVEVTRIIRLLPTPPFAKGVRSEWIADALDELLSKLAGAHNYMPTTDDRAHIYQAGVAIRAFVEWGDKVIDVGVRMGLFEEPPT